MTRYIFSAFIFWPLFAFSQSGVIYGEDNRLEPFEIGNTDLVNLSRATVMISYGFVVPSDKGGRHIKLNTNRLNNVCPEEKFSDQHVGGFCSGFLIASDLIMTAGHCIPYQRNCENSWYIFDYGLYGKGENYTETTDDKIYRCKKLIHSENTKSQGGADLAIIQLDRPVTDRLPVKLERQTSIHENDRVFMIGYPLGLPAKYTYDATVTKFERKHFFRTDLDAYHGNSGSPVFNERTNRVEGILVAGENDFIRTSKNCDRSKVCRPGDKCMGELVMGIALALDKIPADSEQRITDTH